MTKQVIVLYLTLFKSNSQIIKIQKHLYALFLFQRPWSRSRLRRKEQIVTFQWRLNMFTWHRWIIDTSYICSGAEFGACPWLSDERFALFLILFRFRSCINSYCDWSWCRDIAHCTPWRCHLSFCCLISSCNSLRCFLQQFVKTSTKYNLKQTIEPKLLILVLPGWNSCIFYFLVSNNKNKVPLLILKEKKMFHYVICVSKCFFTDTGHYW